MKKAPKTITLAPPPAAPDLTKATRMDPAHRQALEVLVLKANAAAAHRDRARAEVERWKLAEQTATTACNAAMQAQQQAMGELARIYGMADGDSVDPQTGEISREPAT